MNVKQISIKYHTDILSLNENFFLNFILFMIICLITFFHRMAIIKCMIEKYDNYF